MDQGPVVRETEQGTTGRARCQVELKRKQGPDPAQASQPEAQRIIKHICIFKRCFISGEQNGLVGLWEGVEGEIELMGVAIWEAIVVQTKVGGGNENGEE